MNILSNAGPISFSQIRQVYGLGNRSLNVSSLYRGGDVVPEYNSNVPTTSNISISSLYASYKELAGDIKQIAGSASFNPTTQETTLTTTASGQVGYALLIDNLANCSQCFCVSFDVKVRNPASTPGNAFWLSIGTQNIMDDTSEVNGTGIRFVFDDAPNPNTYAIYYGNTLQVTTTLGFLNANNTWRNLKIFIDKVRNLYRVVYDSFDRTDILTAYTLPGNLISIGAATGSQSNEYMIRNVSLNRGPIFDDVVRTFPQQAMTRSNSTITTDYGYSATYIASLTTTLSNDESNFGAWRAFDSSSNTTFARCATGQYDSNGNILVNSNWLTLYAPSMISLRNYSVYGDNQDGTPYVWTLQASYSNTDSSFETLDNAFISTTVLWPAGGTTYNRTFYLELPKYAYQNYRFVPTNTIGASTFNGSFRIGNIMLSGYEMLRSSTSNVYDLGAYNMSPYMINFSNTDARWIHNLSNAQSNAPEGVIWLRKTITTTSNAISRLHVVADKKATVYVNNALIFDTGGQSNSYLTQTFVLPRGSNTFSVQLSNYGGTRSGLLMAVERPSFSLIRNIQYSYAARWVLKTDSTWESTDPIQSIYFPPSLTASDMIYRGYSWSTQSSSQRTTENRARFRAFDGMDDSVWETNDNTYDSNTRSTLSNIAGFFSPNDDYYGSWIILNFPYAVNISGYDLFGNPDSWRLYASENGSNSNVGATSPRTDWFLLDSRDLRTSNITNNVLYSYQLSAPCTSNIRRLGFRFDHLISTSAINFGRANIRTLRYYGWQVIPKLQNYDLLFTNIGTSNWTVPSSVTSISAVCIGGGGGGGCGTGGALSACGAGGGGALYYANNISVVPGEVLTIGVGNGGIGGIRANSVYNGSDGGDSYVARGASYLVLAKGGKGGTTDANGGLGGNVASCIGSGGGSGGNAVFSSSSCQGGGGAGGYSGNGGMTASNGSGGGGAGGNVGNATFFTGGGGGGVGLYGEGSNGTVPALPGAGGTGGSGGISGDSGAVNPGIAGNGGLYGGGGGSTDDIDGNPQKGGNGGQGAVRIVCNHTIF